MKVLVSGGAGYIGSILTERLLAGGYEVYVLDSLVFQQRSLFHLCHNKNLHFIYGDCRDDALLVDILSEVDVIIPLAAIVGAPACQLHSADAWGINFDAIRMINSMRSKAQPVLFPNTNSGYGSTPGTDECTEDSPLVPISTYAHTKLMAEKILLDTGNAISFRLATVFGMSPRMRIDLLVNNFVYLAMTEGTITIFEKEYMRNYVHVRDIADAFVYAIEHFDEMKDKPYNVGQDSANMSKAQVAELIQKYVPRFVVNYNDYAQDPDRRNYIVSNERLRHAGFEARRTLDEGIQELIKGFSMVGRSEMKNV